MRPTANSIWILLTGLSLGFILGRELPVARHGDQAATVTATAAGGSGGSGSGSAAQGGGGSQAIPANWITEDQINSSDAFKGLTPQQRYTVLKVLNEMPCDCGCPHGSVATCKKEDPACPRAPTIIANAVAAAKTGAKYDDVLAAAKKKEGGGAAAPEQTTGKAELAAWTPIKGNKLARVTLVLFSDFQCPFCSKVVPTLKQIEQGYPKDVRIAFRHQPLPFHNFAREAAEVAMAANAQGKFWQMHDKLFENQSALDRPSLDKYAQAIGLDMARYKADMDAHKYKDQVDSDSKRGTELGASGTPTMFINGQKVVGAQPFDTIKKTIDEELKKADSVLSTGVKPDKLYETILTRLPANAPAKPAAPPQPEHVDNLTAGDSPSKGPADAKVTVIAFSDFQCPFCSKAVPTIHQLEQDYKGQIRLVFKQQPLPFHDKAQLAAEASLAANEQGRFWEMHDRLFANQDKLTRPDLEAHAQALGLNVDKFKAALDSGKFKAKVKSDQAEAAKVGATGTPTFFVNGWRIVGAQPPENFKKLIDQELQKKK